MADKDKILLELQRMRREALVEMAQGLGVATRSSWNRRTIAAAIRKKQLANSASAGPAGEPAIEPAGQARPLPGFEAALEDQDVQDEIEAAEVDRRGGPRPGAGRPVGMTDEKAAVKRLPQQPSEPIVAAMKLGLGAVSMRIGLPDLVKRVGDDPIRAAALPWTQLQEYYFPGALPEIAHVWVMAVYQSWELTSSIRAAIIEAIQEQQPAQPQPTEHRDPEIVNVG